MINILAKLSIFIVLIGLGIFTTLSFLVGCGFSGINCDLIKWISVILLLISFIVGLVWTLSNSGKEEKIEDNKGSKKEWILFGIFVFFLLLNFAASYVFKLGF